MRSLYKILFAILFIAGVQQRAVSQTTLVAGDIAFTGYLGFGASATTDEFSFVLLRNVTAGTTINFTDNGWLSTNVFRTGETTVTWTAATALNAGTEVKIVGTTPTLAGAGNPGTVTGTALSLSANGDQILAYQGTAATPTFISAIHMNVYDVANADPVTTTAAAWDGTANTANSSALPTGLTTGTNAIWIGTQGNINSEKDNARFVCAGDLSTVASIKGLIYDQTKWTTSDGDPAGFLLPTGCSYIVAAAAPTFTLNPVSGSVCEGANTSFTITATGALTYQWEVDPGSGFTAITNSATYSGATTPTLSITAATNSLNGYQYRCVASNGGGSTNSTAATLTVTALPVNPTLLAKTPASGTVADGTPVSATFNAGSGGTGCADDFRYTTNGGATYLPYTPGSNISTTGLAAGTGVVTIEGRRANCSAGCQGTYVALATWVVTPLPAGATTLNAGDIAFSSYAAATEEFSFVLLRNIGPGTVISFTNNGWLSTNVFRTGEETVTWTSNAAYQAGTEIRISGLTATLASGGSAGSVLGTALNFNINGDQILAYRGSAAAPTFISAIHMNVFTVANGDPVTTTAAAWDGTANSINASALPTGLTTGVNAIWIGTQGVIGSEFDNAKFGNCSNPAVGGSINALRSALNNQLNWTANNNTPTPGFAIPTGCNYLGALSAPTISANPAPASVCAGATATFTVTAAGATGYQWQVDQGSGFVNVTDNTNYAGSLTATLTISNTPIGFNGYQYRCVASNGTGSANSTAALLTVTAVPVAPTLLAKTPAAGTVADGTPVSATFNAGSGGTGCADDFRYTTDGGATYLPYTPGSNISTTGVAAGSGFVFIEGRRANCSAGCQGTYTVLASWVVTPLPASPTTLNAGDLGFTSYSATTDVFSFVLLKNVGAGTAINFTNNGWLSTNVFRTGEETVTWTAPAGGLTAGTEIRIAGLTATRSGGGAAGTVAGTALGLNNTGDQILAYRGTAASPTFISAIHMNVYSVANGDPVSTTAAAWDGTANAINASALPTGLTTGVNAIWIGTQDVPASEFTNAAFGNCSGPGVLGPLTGLRAALNNQANWVRNNNAVPGFSIPTGCNFLSLLTPTVNVTGTPLSAFAGCSGTPSAEQNFVVSGTALTGDITITAPAGFEISTTSGSGFVSSLNLTPSGGGVPNTTIYVRLTAAATGTPSGNITVASPGVATTNIAVSGTVTLAPTTAAAGADASVCGLGYTLQGNTAATGTGTWSQVAGPGTSTFTNANDPLSPVTVSVQGLYTFRWTIANAPCPASTDDVDITFSSTPTTANAGADRSLCLPSSALTMAGNAPAVGTGTWTQIAGPVTATITNAANPVTSVTGMSTAGVYTFVWTISNGACTPSTDTMNVTVAGVPAAFSIVGTTDCKGVTYTINGPAINPGETYRWQRSLSGIINSYTNFGGTAQTQAVTESGNYQLTVTNAAGCSVSDTAVVHLADYRFTGSIGAGDPSQTGRINRLAQTSVCATPKAFPGMFTTAGARLYDSYTITNARPVPVCAIVGIASGCGVNIFNVAYSGSFNPADPSQNYLADPGSSFPSSGFMEVTIPANGSIVMVVHEVNPGTGCANYTLTVDVPRDPAAISVVPNTPPICAGTNITLTGAYANTYSWTPGGATTQAITVAPATTTKYTVTYGYGNVGCTGLDSATINIAPPVTTAFAGNDTATCGTAIVLAANTPVVGTGAWSQVSGPGTISFGNVNSPSSSATASVTGSYTLRWTITAGAPCPGTSADDVVVNFAANPTVANAGGDLTACMSPGSTSLAGNAPAVGTGAWSQVAGPVATNIISPSLPNTLITGLNTPGTYTYRWTISNAPCTASFDEVNVVVNSNPATPAITGGGTFCPPGTTLSTPAVPNTTYQWGRSFLAAPYSGLGTGPTLAVTASGSYQLIATNQFGCSSSATTVVNVAEYVFNGSLTGTDAQQTGRLNRFASISTCAAPKSCPLTFTTAGSRAYDSYTVTNSRNVPVCATIGLNSGCGTAVFSAAYLGSYNPTSLCTNYLADPGSSPATSIFYEATIPANSSIVIVVHEVNPGQSCANYTLTVGLPRDTLITVTPNDTVCSGTSVTLTAPFADSYLWTPGGATTQAITVTPATGTNTYSVQSGFGNNGCTTTLTQDIVVNATPTVNAVPNQYFCANSTSSPITLSGPVTGTVYNWTNSNPAIGLAASGTGDIPAFLATNSTAAPISGTITVTPVAGTCTGTPITFTITVPNATVITSVTEDSVCAPGGVVNLAATGTGTINWFDAATGGVLLNTGTTYSPNITATTTYYVESQVTTPAAQTLAMPAQSNTFPGNIRGYWFTAPVDFVITSLLVPTTASSGPQNIAVVKFNGNTPPPVFSATTNAFTTVFLSRQNPSIGKIPCNIQVRAGEVIGILGSRGGINTYAPGDYATTIFGQPVQLERLGMQFPLETTNPQNLWREFGATTSISRVVFEYASATCSSAPRVPVTGTVLPQPVASATPSSQTVCSGPITTIALGSNIAGTTFTWTRDNTANVSGIAASGTGSSISGTLTNLTTVPQTVTFTITPTSPLGCVGNTITATVTIQSVPTIICPANITLNSAPGVCGNNATYTPSVTGIPAPSLAYTFTGATTGSGSGSGSGSLFNVGVTTVTIVATNTCGSANCSFTVTVNDVEPPVITCPPTITVSCAAAVPAPDINSVVATDNCPVGLTVIHVGDVISNQTCANRYTITRTYRATDASNNSTTCTQTITVNDVTPPVMTCPAPVTVSCVSEVPAPDINAVTGVSDNCAGPVTVTFVNDVISNQTCANRYTITRTYRAEDACGNYTECQQIITVNDQTPPVMTCPAPVTVSCASAVPAPNINAVTGVSDNCGGVVVVTFIGDVISNQTCANRYTITRTYRATDVCGNFSECTQIITVNDQTPPVMTCPAPITVCGPAAVPAPNINAVTGVSDNCGGAVTVTFISDVNNCPACVNVPYTITRTYRATDACGNFSECTQIITVNPIPTVNTVSNLTVCNSASTGAINFSGAVAGTVYNWTNNTTSIGLGASGTGNIPSFTATNATGAPVVATITVTPQFTNAGQTCTGTPTTFTITVNPTPTVNVVANQTVCNGSPTTAISFSGNAAGTVYNWTNNNTTIGLGASGTGDIASFNGINTGTAPVTATITVTPVYTNNGVTCTGTARTFTITVNPTPVVNAVANNTYCEGTTVPSVVFGTTATGGTVTYAWTRTAGPIGLAATSGTGNIPAFTAATTGGAPLTVTFSVTATITNNGVSCSGPVRTFTITVNPTPVITPINNRAVCVGSTSAPIVFSSNTPGAVFNWTRTNQAIGLAATSGTGDIPSFLATNTGTTPLVSTFTVTATYTNNGVSCTSAPVTFTLTVNPLPVVSFALPFDTLYQNPGIIQLTGGTPTGGVYSGVGIGAQGILNPAALSLGNYTVRYTYTDINGCTASAVDVFTVIARSPRINVYPNPTRGNVKVVVTPDLIGATMEVYSMVGRNLVGTFKIAGRQNDYYFPWASGTYNLVFRIGNERIVRQILIAR